MKTGRNQTFFFTVSRGRRWLQVAERFSKGIGRTPSALQAWLRGLGLVTKALYASISLIMKGSSVRSAKTTLQNSSVLFSVDFFLFLYV